MTTISHRTGRSRASYRIGVFCMAICCLCVALPANAQQPPSAATDAAIVERFVGETTILVFKVDPARIGLADLNEAIETMPPDAQAAYRQVSDKANTAIKQLRALVDDQTVYATVGVPISNRRMSTYVFVNKSSPANDAKLMEFLNRQLKSKSCIHGEYIVGSPINGVDVAESLAASPASSREEIEIAFESVADYPAQMLLLPPPYVRRTLRELSTELPSQLGGGPSSVLTDGLQWAALGIDPMQLRAQLVIQSTSEAAASDLAAQLPKMLQSACDAAPQIQKQIPEELLQALISWLNPQVEGKQIVIRMQGFEKTSGNLKLLAVVAQTIGEKTRRETTLNRFKQILIGMHNYYDVNGSFPPADKHRDEDGKHRLSWRVHILPYVEENRLYEEFHLDEPWDSPHNKKLVTKMPDIYRSHVFELAPSVAIKPGHTTFLAPVGEDTILGGAEATKFHDVRDGTSNTVVLVEVKPRRAVPWTAPDDYVIDPQDPGVGLGIGTDGRWLCAFADGSVHQLRGDISAETLLHLFQISDGHPIDYKKIR